MIITETERLILRQLTLNDSEFVLKLLNEPSYLQFIGDKKVRTLDDAAQYISNSILESYARYGFGLYLVELKEENNAPIGMCGLIKRPVLPDIDIGFAFLPLYWSKGYAFESASAVMTYGQSILGLTRILAITSVNNHSSIKLLERLGLKFERLIKLFENEPEINLFSLDFGAKDQ